MAENGKDGVLYSGGISLYTSIFGGSVKSRGRDVVFRLYFISYFSIVGDSNAKDGMLFSGGISLNGKKRADPTSK